MSESFYNELEGLIGKHREKEAAEKRDEETEARFKRLEDGIGKIGEVIEERLPKDSPAADPDKSSAANRGEDDAHASEQNPPPESEPEPDVERIETFTIPRIYSGEDEPEIVNYIDADTGEAKTRKGRKKNRPTGYDVQKIAAEVTTEPQIPTEPNEETG